MGILRKYQTGNAICTSNDDRRCEETDRIQEHLDQVADWKRKGLDISWDVALSAMDNMDAVKKWKEHGRAQTLKQRLGTPDQNPYTCAYDAFSGIRCTPAQSLVPAKMTESNYKAVTAVKSGNSNFEHIGDFNNYEELLKNIKPGDYISLKGTDTKGKSVSHMQVFSHFREDGQPVFLDSSGDENDFGASIGMNRPVSSKLTGTLMRLVGDKKFITEQEEKARLNPTYVTTNFQGGILYKK